MKKVFCALCVLIFMIPNIVLASVLNEVPPYVDISGMDESNYKITKTITSDRVIIDLVDKRTNEEYSWSFDKSKIKGTLNLDFKIDFKSKKEQEIISVAGKSDKLYLSFSYHGQLPKGTKIRVNVGEKFKNGDTLALYYYNEEKHEAEFIKDGLKVENGFVEFDLDHCSEYFLTKVIVNNVDVAPKTLNTVIIVLTFVAISVGAYSVFKYSN